MVEEFKRINNFQRSLSTGKLSVIGKRPSRLNVTQRALSKGNLCDANQISVSNPDIPFQLLMDSEGAGAKSPISIPTLLNRVVKDFGDYPALNYRNSYGEWQTITYRQYQDRVEKMAKVFINLGLERHHTVAVMASNSPEWFVSELAAIHAGGIITGIYTSATSESIHQILENSRAQIIIVDETEQLEKILEIKDRLPKLKAIIQTNPPPYQNNMGLDCYYKWRELEHMDTEDLEDQYEERLNDIVINECCCLMYTPGTSGKSKGVMLSHDNLTWTAYTIGQTFDAIQIGKEVIVSYLPLSHVGVQLTDIFLSLTYAFNVYFADKDALNGSLFKTVSEVRPTHFVAGPKIYENIQDKLLTVEANTDIFQSLTLSWAKNVSFQYHLNKLEGKDASNFQYNLSKKFISMKIKKTLGLDRCHTLISADGPISKKIKEFFMSIDMPLSETFGMNETSGAHSVIIASSDKTFNLETCGKGFQGTRTKILNPSKDGYGEILLKGRHIFKGYINDEAETNKVIDLDGWLHTGDYGYKDSNGLIYLKGRKKEIIVTADGVKILPIHIENLIKSELPMLSHAFVIGDNKEYLTVLLTLKTEVDSDTGAPKDQLQVVTKKWVASLGLGYTKMSELMNDGPHKKILQSIQEGIERTNQNSNFSKIQNFKILPQDFSIAGGELGPTFKVKRDVVIEKYQDLIDELYQS